MLLRDAVADRRTIAGQSEVRAMTFITVRKSLTTVFVMFLVLSFWQNPSASADVFRDFVNDVGGFFSAIIDKTAEFIKALV